MSEDNSTSCWSAQPEPTMSELFVQMARMMRSFERTQLSLEWSAQALDATTDITTSDESIFWLGQFLARSEPCHRGLLGSPPALPPLVPTQTMPTAPAAMVTQQVAPLITAQLLGAVQLQVIPCQMGAGPMGQSIDRQQENYWGVHLPPPPPFAQSQAGARIRGQVPPQGPPQHQAG